MTSEAVRPTVSVTPLNSAPSPDRFELAEHNCFGCGALNLNGLGLRLHVEPGRSWAEFELERRFEGWEGIAHGGIVATILDEVMAWALVGEDNWGVTARLSVRFAKPVPLGARLRADGWTTRLRRRIVDTEGRLVEVATGTELASATGVYVAADADQKRDLQARYGFRLLDPSPNGNGR